MFRQSDRICLCRDDHVHELVEVRASSLREVQLDDESI
jgi:hypothetical protein